MKHTPLRYLARIQNSNVDKVIEDGETPVRLCNYVHVFRNDKITADMAFDQGSATKMERKVFALNPGDVIITKDSEDPREIGVPALVVSSAEDIVCGYHLTILKPNEGVHGPYLFYGLCSKVAQEQFMLSARGITRFGLNQTGIGDCAIPLPSMARQVEIANMLERNTRLIDDMIKEKSGFITLLQEKRVAEISHAVTKGINPDTPMKPSGADWLGDVPAHWDAVPANWLFQPSKKLAMEGDQLLSATQKYGVIPLAEFEELAGRKVTLALTNLEKRKHVEVGDFVISMRSMDGGLERARARGSVRSSYIVLKFTDEVDGRFYGYLLKSNLFIQALRLTANFVRDGQDMHFGHFRAVKLPRLPCLEQAAIANHLDRETTRIDGLIHETEHSIALLKEKRAALITAAVTGKINVRNAA